MLTAGPSKARSRDSAESARHVVTAFRQTMRELGWIDDQNIIIETRFADGDVNRLPALVDELLLLKVDVIVTGSSAAIRAA